MTRTNAALPSRDGVTSAGYDEANEVLNFTPATASAKNLTYDENGNLSSVTNSCGTTTYAWDARNRLVGITGYMSDCSTLSASFDYDAIGRRIEKTVNGVTTQYLYDGMDIIQEIQGGTVTANYVRSLKIDEPLARIKADGTVRYYQTDALGSVIALTDENGNVMTTYTYDPFGNVTVSGEASDNPFQYTGRENDETGLYYYRARYYSPELQRFISEDPIGLAGGINQFAYVGNNPANLIDPLGLVVNKGLAVTGTVIFLHGAGHVFAGVALGVVLVTADESGVGLIAFAENLKGAAVVVGLTTGGGTEAWQGAKMVWKGLGLTNETVDAISGAAKQCGK
jgi:RHS repeat-associated protein